MNSDKGASRGAEAKDHTLTEADLRKRVATLASIINFMPQSIYWKDKDGVYLGCNGQFARTLGWGDAARIIGKTDADLPWCPEEAATQKADAQEVILRRRPQRRFMEFGPRSDGTFARLDVTKAPLLDETGAPCGVLGLCEDFAERRRADEAIRQSEERFRSIVDSSPVAMHLYRLDAGGRLVLAGGNLAAERALGISHGELSGRTLEDVFPGLKATDVPSMCRRVALGELGPQSSEVSYSDTRFTGFYDIRFYRTGENTLALNFLDITERKRLEDQRLQQEKMQAVSQLAGGVAHDFNNQLGGILGFAELLAESLGDPTLKGYAASIMTAATRSADLTRQLLAFNRRGKLVSVPTEVHKVIVEVVDFLKGSFDKQIGVKLRLEATLSAVLADPAQIQNAVLNLGLNARDAMPNGGELTFATQVVVVSEGQPLDDLMPGRYVQINVIDTGVGMDQATKKRLFEPFFTTKEVGKGTGLGLAAAYGTVRNHGGTIRAQSELGRGSTFSVYLPVHDAAAVAAVPAVGAAASPAGRGRIMIVDDEPIILELGGVKLRGLGYDVSVYLDPVAALESYRKDWASVDLVVLDMVMPRMGGRELYLAMRDVNPHVRVLLASGYSVAGEAQSIMELGVLAFVQKPFRRAELAQKVAALIGTR
jgi:two-component system cell cycle sensor histidine kinase/response regulator CckA